MERIPKFYFVIVLLLVISGCANFKFNLVTADITHVSCTKPSSGAINQTIHLLNLSSLSVVHHWSKGNTPMAQTTEDLIGLSCIYPSTYNDDIAISGLSIKTKNQVLFETEWGLLNNLNINTSNGLLSNSGASYQLGWGTSINSLPANVPGYFEFVIAGSGSQYGSGAIGFAEILSNNNNNAALTVSDGFLFIASQGGAGYYLILNEGHLTSLATPGTYAIGDRFSLKMGVNSISYYKNGVMVASVNPNGILPLNHPPYNVSCQIANNRVAFQSIHTSFGCSSVNEGYASLKKQLDGAVYTMTGKISIKYKEKYNDDELDYVVYNWKHEPMISNLGGAASINVAPLESNQAGVNYINIPVGNKLQNEEIYTLEITNSKGEIYMIRFKYNNYLEGVEMISSTVPAIQFSGENGNDYE